MIEYICTLVTLIFICNIYVIYKFISYINLNMVAFQKNVNEVKKGLNILSEKRKTRKKPGPKPGSKRKRTFTEGLNNDEITHDIHINN